MKGICFVLGQEEYLLEQGKKSFLQACSTRLKAEIRVHTYGAAATMQEVVEMLESTDLFGGKDIVIWRQPSVIRGKHKGASRKKLTSQEEWFIDKVTSLAETSGLLFYIEGTVDEKDPLFKALLPFASVVRCNPLEVSDILTFIQQYLQQQGHRLLPAGRTYLQALFSTWETLPLRYIVSELERLCLIIEPHQDIRKEDVDHLFVDNMDKKLFTFMDYFFAQQQEKIQPFCASLFNSKQYIKNLGTLGRTVRLMIAYKELQAMRMGEKQLLEIMQEINMGRPMRGELWHIKQKGKNWSIASLRALSLFLFHLQFDIRQGVLSIDDIEPLLCSACKPNYHSIL